MRPEHAFEDFDLNLLRVLDVLLEVQSVTRAGAVLGMTQPGVSRALKRLREHFDDPLLVREGRQMHLTSVAQALRAPVGRVLEDSRRLFVSGAGFDPAEVQWSVRIAVADYPQLVLLPTLAAAVSAEAPGLDIHTVSAIGGTPEPLVEGRIDFAIEPAGLIDSPDLVSSRLFTDNLCCVLRAGHPLANKRLTMRRLADLEHVFVAPSGGSGGFVDRALAEHGLRRRVRVQVASFAATMPLIATSDCVVTLPQRIAEHFAERWSIVLRPLPMKGPTFTMSVYWAARHRTDTAHRWFREVLRAAAGQLPQV